MKKREIISMIMALTMVISAASCGSVEKTSAADSGSENFAANAEKSDDVGKAEGAAPSGETAAEPAATTAAAMKEETAAVEADVEADGGDLADAAAPMVAFDGMAADAKTKKGGMIEGEMGEAAADFAADGITADDHIMTDEPIEPDDGDTSSSTDIDEPDSSEPDPEPDLPEAGQLTAGEWNDNDNWGFFSNLVNAGTISFPVFSLDPTTRVSVKVKTADGKPAVNAKVKLLDEDGKTIWNAVSDKQGMAYLFATGSSVPATIEAELDGDKQTADYKAPEKDEQGNKKVSKSSTEITLDGESKLYKDTEIMFIVDTTGSMSDEMLFLQSEFSAIAREVGGINGVDADNVKFAVSFYRDEGDDYVTKHNDFTSDVSALQKALNNEEADGGGDFPEAVAQVLSETITDGKWSKDSVKLAFLIFDAPPHEGTDKKLMEAAKAAGEKGIRIVPIVSSGSDRETELFARSLAIMSGGTYVFLTDDSGIGGGHLEPIIGDYKVEKLYDIIIRVINDYRQ